MPYVKPHMRKAFEDHELACICDTEKVKVFTLRRPGTRNMSVQLSFTPEGIHITGDLSLGPHQSGVGTSHDRKPLGWFANPELSKSPRYICEKFLPRTLQYEVMVENARFQAEEYAREASDETWDEEEKLRCHKMAGKWLAFAIELESQNDEHDAITCMRNAYYSTDDSDSFENFGMDYPRTDAGWLLVIQETFAKLYHAWREAEEETDE